MTAFEIDANEWSNVLPSIKIVEFIQKPVTIEKVERLVLTHIHKKVCGKTKKETFDCIFKTSYETNGVYY